MTLERIWEHFEIVNILLADDILLVVELEYLIADEIIRIPVTGLKTDGTVVGLGDINGTHDTQVQ